MERRAHDGVNDRRVKEVRNEIARWRRTREKRTTMPAELWAAARALARARGTYRMARALRVDYESLARRVAEAGGERTAETKSDGFVELRGADLLGGATVVEVSDIDGARMTIRIGAGSALDATALVSAFRRRAA
jgi:hypothetical protein